MRPSSATDSRESSIVVTRVAMGTRAAVLVDQLREVEPQARAAVPLLDLAHGPAHDLSGRQRGQAGDLHRRDEDRPDGVARGVTCWLETRVVKRIESGVPTGSSTAGAACGAGEGQRHDGERTTQSLTFTSLSRDCTPGPAESQQARQHARAHHAALSFRAG